MVCVLWCGVVWCSAWCGVLRGFWVWRVGLKVSGLGVQFEGFEFRISGFELRVSSFGFHPREEVFELFVRDSTRLLCQPQKSC